MVFFLRFCPIALRLLKHIAIAGIAVACAKREMQPEDLRQYTLDPDHGLFQSKKVGDFKLNVLARPTDDLVYQEANTLNIKKETLDSLREKYNKQYYFILSLSYKGNDPLAVLSGSTFSEALQILSFNMNEYVNLTTQERDTIPVGDFLFNRTFGVSKSSDVLFVFHKSKIQDSKWVDFNLTDFGLGTGNQRFRFKTNDLENTPLIKFNVY
jgi:hypothetical protein